MCLGMPKRHIWGGDSEKRLSLFLGRKEKWGRWKVKENKVCKHSMSGKLQTGAKRMRCRVTGNNSGQVVGTSFR